MNSRPEGSPYPYTELLRRHPSLKPFARDHGTGLICVQRLHKAISTKEGDLPKLTSQVRMVCQKVITAYLQDEHRILASVVPSELIDDYYHRYNNVCLEIDKLLLQDQIIAPEADLLARIANALNDYIRWEERTLFPAIEEMLPPRDLEQLTEKTAAIDATHSRLTQKLHSSTPGAENEWLAGEGNS